MFEKLNSFLAVINWKAYPHTPSLGPNYCDGNIKHLHCDHGNIGYLEISSVLILGEDLKCWETITLVTVFRNDICAGTHEVKVSSIKSTVVRISHCPACSRIFFYWNTGGTAILHLTHLIDPAGDAAAGQRCTSC